RAGRILDGGVERVERKRRIVCRGQRKDRRRAFEIRKVTPGCVADGFGTFEKGGARKISFHSRSEGRVAEKPAGFAARKRRQRRRRSAATFSLSFERRNDARLHQR